MLTKIVLLFLLVIVLLAMLGKLHWIGGPRLASPRCTACGRFRIGKQRCPCGHGGRDT
ncbi:hypothetical protein AB1M95_14745 [Sulfitobacter sp. LCG007]